MSLPLFGDKKKMASSIMERRNKAGGRDYSTEVANEDDKSEGDYLKGCAGDLLAAIERKSPGDIAQALRDIFGHLESEPHEEYDGDDSSESEE